MPKPKDLLPLEQVVSQHLIAVNEGLQMCLARFAAVPLPLMTPVSGQLVIKQMVARSVEHDKLFAADTSAKQVGEMTLTLDLERESEAAWKLRLGDIKIIDENGNEIPFPPMPVN